MNTFDIVLRILAVVPALFSMLVICVRPFRNWMLGNKAKKAEEEARLNAKLAALVDSQQCTLRTILTDFYYNRYTICTMRQYEFENLQRVYAAYKQLGGNSFADKVWEEMKDWEIVQ